MNTETPRQYKDVSGNPCSFGRLVRNEPEWAANQIRHRDQLERELAEQTSSHATTISHCIKLVNENDWLMRELASEKLRPVALMRQLHRAIQDAGLLAKDRDAWREVAEELARVLEEEAGCSPGYEKECPVCVALDAYEKLKGQTT